MIYLEDDDVAVVMEGKLYVHRVKRTAGDDPVRVIQTLQMELQQIMKGTTSLMALFLCMLRSGLVRLGLAQFAFPPQFSTASKWVGL